MQQDLDDDKNLEKLHKQANMNQRYLQNNYRRQQFNGQNPLDKYRLANNNKNKIKVDIENQIPFTERNRNRQPVSVQNQGSHNQYNGLRIRRGYF